MTTQQFASRHVQRQALKLALESRDPLYFVTHGITADHFSADGFERTGYEFIAQFAAAYGEMPLLDTVEQERDIYELRRIQCESGATVIARLKAFTPPVAKPAHVISEAVIQQAREIVENVPNMTGLVENLRTLLNGSTTLDALSPDHLNTISKMMCDHLPEEDLFTRVYIGEGEFKHRIPSTGEVKSVKTMTQEEFAECDALIRARATIRKVAGTLLLSFMLQEAAAVSTDEEATA